MGSAFLVGGGGKSYKKEYEQLQSDYAQLQSNYDELYSKKHLMKINGTEYECITLYEADEWTKAGGNYGTVTLSRSLEGCARIEMYYAKFEGECGISHSTLMDPNGKVIQCVCMNGGISSSLPAQLISRCYTCSGTTLTPVNGGVEMEKGSSSLQTNPSSYGIRVLRVDGWF